MPTSTSEVQSPTYARTLAASRRARWEIDRDVLRGRRFELAQKFLPDGLSRVHELAFLSPDEQRFLSQVQGRTYANLFGQIERFISAKVLELTRDHWFGDQLALECLVRFSEEELKHQELFRRVEALAAEAMPPGYACMADGDAIARLVLTKSSWAVLALTCHIELFTLQHYKESIQPEPELSALFKDVFLFHWKEESQHAVLDELEWRRIDAALSAAERERGVDDFLALVAAVDGVLQAQAAADAGYFARHCGRALAAEEARAVEAGVLAAYRWQYILSGMQGRFPAVLESLIDEAQYARVERALAGLA